VDHTNAVTLLDWQDTDVARIFCHLILGFLSQ
jgi:hypothetical protein